ncbi:MAG: hypothetical protein L3K18_06085 [Thermoplasmata archaeon]|nr:hypothetical protein [Thermoplasmata archaeon]
MAKLDSRTTGRIRRGDALPLAAMLVCLVVVVELLSMLPIPPLAGPREASLAHAGLVPRVGSPPAPGSALVQAASASLREGAGPAGGVPWNCTSAASPTGVHCGTGSSSSARPSITPTTPSWTEIAPPAPSGRTYGSMVYDAKDGYVLLFGGLVSGPALQDTWTFVGGTWTQLTPASSPSARGAAAICFDSADHYVVLFGGFSGTSYLADTWKFSGGLWTVLSPTSHPSARADAAMSYDTKDGYAVLFGGFDAALTGRQDTWEFSAGQWTPLTLATHPAGRSQAAMAYDSADGYVVLFGGTNTTTLGDTWNFTGGLWTQLTPLLVAPGARYLAGLANSAKDGKLILFGGHTSVGRVSDAWTFSGGSWTKVSSSVHPTSRDGPMVADGPATGNIVLFGGVSPANAVLNDTWTFHGLVWTHVLPHLPAPRSFDALTYDEADGYVLLFGGGGLANNQFGDTWKYFHGAWTQLHPAQSPSARVLPGMTYDQADGYVILFGGTSPAGATDFSDTWTFLAGAWHADVAAVGPPSRYAPGLTYDAADGYVLMFGGENVSNVDMSDTWAFQGGVWWDPVPALSPNPDPRGGPEMTYDSEDGYVVLFSGAGTGSSPPPATTWTYVGGSWTNITSRVSTQPPAGAAAGFVDDTYDGYLLLYGEFEGGTKYGNQTWEYLGGVWTQLAPAVDPGHRGFTGMAFDPNDNVAVVFGGATATGIASGTWTY